MGLGAASPPGIADAGAYAQDLVFFTLDSKAYNDIATKLRHDFDATHVAVPGDKQRTGMHDLLMDVVR